MRSILITSMNWRMPNETNSGKKTIRKKYNFQIQERWEWLRGWSKSRIRMQSGDRLDVEIIYNTKILNFVGWLNGSAHNWNCDMVQVFRFCGKRQCGSSLSLCDKHDMFYDLQADNAIDFADFTDMRPDSTTMRTASYTFTRLYIQLTIHLSEPTPTWSNVQLLTLSLHNKQNSTKTFYGRRNAHCFYYWRTAFFLLLLLLLLLPPPSSYPRTLPNTSCVAYISHRWYSYYCT